jgi:hypothetical protein
MGDRPPFSVFNSIHYINRFDVVDAAYYDFVSCLEERP